MWFVLSLLPALAAPGFAEPGPEGAGFGDPFGRCGGPAEGLGEKIRRETACLVKQAGPRGPMDPEGRQRMFAAVHERIPAGFLTELSPGPYPTLIACRPGKREETLLLLAHVDAVAHDVAGAADNAASIASLLATARRLPEQTEQTICLAFPDGEEIGLVGSRALARSLFDEERSYAQGLLRAASLDLVVSLDLIGEGQVTWNGLGPAWDAEGLRTLTSLGRASVPWVYRALSLHRPDMERSDHSPFARRGVRAAHLMSRGRSGVTWAYHTPRDDVEVLNPSTLEAAAELILDLSTTEPLGPPARRGELAIVTPWTHLVIPGWLSWLWLVLAMGSAVVPWLPTRRHASQAEPPSRWPRNLLPWLRALGWLLALPVAAGAGLSLAALGRPLEGALASPALVAAWIGALSLALWWPRRGDDRQRLALATIPTALTAASLLTLGLPLLALPVATPLIGLAIASRAAHDAPVSPTATPGSRAGRAATSLAALLFAAPLSLWPALYLLRGDAYRELSFHGLMQGVLPLVLLFALLGPAALAWLPSRPPLPRPFCSSLRIAHALLLAMTIFWSWSSSPWQPPFEEREVRFPISPRTSSTLQPEPGR
ncbi:MAG: Zn-dependent exopeptidase M28 [Deltaproteobacteria bacterium]|nr:MAG: Zn-dependent exopeptidase M28 [Deltaproteobacteria bacterium]